MMASPTIPSRSRRQLANDCRCTPIGNTESTIIITTRLKELDSKEVVGRHHRLSSIWSICGHCQFVTRHRERRTENRASISRSVISDRAELKLTEVDQLGVESRNRCRNSYQVAYRLSMCFVLSRVAHQNFGHGLFHSLMYESEASRFPLLCTPRSWHEGVYPLRHPPILPWFGFLDCCVDL